MKKTFWAAAVSLTITTSLIAVPPTQAAVSTLAMQIIQHGQQLLDYIEFIEQTQNLIQQTEMEIRNLVQLAEDIKNRPLEWLLDLAQKTAELETYRADFNTLAQTFNEMWPDESMLADLAGADQTEIEAANEEYQRLYDEWSSAVDTSLQATFQLTGSQLQEMVDNGEMKAYIEELLMTKDDEGHQRTLEAANQLAALQINEARQLRELIATHAQGETIRDAKEEKRDEMIQKSWEDACKTDKLEDWEKSEKIY